MRAAIYKRVSSLAQSTEGTSLDTQEGSCRRYCDEAGYTCVGVWSDVHTGAELHERKGMSALREQVRAGQVDILVAHAVDRLTRDQIHLGVLLDECERAGVRMETVTEPLDLTPIGQAVLGLRAMAAAIEREKIRERSMRGKAERLSQGHLPTWTNDLYGYRSIRVRKKDHAAGSEKSRRAVQGAEAEVVRYIFRAVAEGVSLHEICRQLNERGVPSPGVGKMHYQQPKTPRWHPSSMHHTVTNPAYKGLSVANRFTRVKFRNRETGVVNPKRQVERPESEWTILEGDLTPALVPGEVWQAANDRLRDNRGVYGKNKRRPYLLRGLVVCACGCAMYSEQEGGKNQRRTYRCSDGKRGLCPARTRVIADDVEGWVWRQALHILRHRDEVVAELRRRYDRPADVSLDTERRLLARRLEELTEQQSRFLRREGSVPWSLIEREVNRLEREKAELQSRLAEVEEAVAGEESQAVRVLEVVALVDRLAAGDPESASFEERVRILNDLGIGVRVSRRFWKLDWLIPVNGVVHEGRRSFLDFAGVGEPTPEQLRETRRLQDEAWREAETTAVGAAYTPARSRAAPRRSPISSLTGSVDSSPLVLRFTAEEVERLLATG